MLLSLSIRNFVIVESLELDFAPGFTVLMERLERANRF